MIEIFRYGNHGLERVKNLEEKCWVNLIAPTSEEIKAVGDKFSVPGDFLTDALDADERARVESEADSDIIILRIPSFEENSEIPFTTMPIGLILPKNSETVISVCSKNNKVVSDFITGKGKPFKIKDRMDFVLYFFLKTTHLYLNDLKEINRRTSAIEYELHQSIKNEELIKLLNLEKCLVYFTTSLKSNDIVMERLQKTKILPFDFIDADIIEDILIDNKQAIEMANIYSNILSGMMDAFASVISNNLNIVMKFLTGISIILMIPTLIASIYGMNIPLPFQHSPHAFLIAISFSLIFSVAGIMFFIRRKWF